MVFLIKIKVYYWILPNNSQTKIVISIYNMQKIQNGFSSFKVKHALHEFSRKKKLFDKFYFYQRNGGPSVILSK